MPPTDSKAKKDQAHSNNGGGAHLIAGFIGGLAVAGFAAVAYLFSREATAETQQQVSVSKTPQETEAAASDDCKVCYEHKVDCVVYPCKHLALCHECADRLHQCPVCRTTIQKRETLFVC